MSSPLKSVLAGPELESVKPENKRCGSSGISRLPSWACREHYLPFMKQRVASAVHHATPSALVDGEAAQKASQGISECSSVLTIQRKEMKQSLSLPDSRAVVRMLQQLLKNKPDVTCIRERGNGKEFITTTALSFWKVAPTLQEPAQHVYLLEGDPKSSQRKRTSQQPRVWGIYNAHPRMCCSQTLKAGAQRAEFPAI